jgi:preprotein translocase subunit SecB
MSNSPLLLKRYFFVTASLKAQTKGDPKAVNRIETKVEVSKPEGHPNDYLVSLNVRIEPHDDTVPCYLGEFRVLGFFGVHENYPSEKCTKLVAVNGASILYGAVREMVANLTARGPWPMVTLVSINFSEGADGQATTAHGTPAPAKEPEAAAEKSGSSKHRRSTASR